MLAPYKFPDLTPLADVKPRTFTPDLDGLIAWLSEQDGTTEYDDWSISDCLVCRFASAVRGIPHDPSKRSFIEAREFLGIPFASGASIFERAAYHQTNKTYAAALARAISLRKGAGS